MRLETKVMVLPVSEGLIDMSARDASLRQFANVTQSLDRVVS